jgi:MFS family permease
MSAYVGDAGSIAPVAPGLTPEAAPAPQFAPLAMPYRGYALSLLMVICVVNFLDRQVVSILAEPIKRDLGLADWQLGMMTGLAFSVLYTVLGLPIARFAERSDRPLIIATAAAVWSAFTVVCGLAQNFTQLILARVGVGVGEAGCTPPALSLISDYSPREKRASAIAFYMLGAPIGSVMGMGIGGLVADAFGWRAAFMMVGVPGVFLAIAAATTLKEPRRAVKQAQKAAAAAAPNFREALKELAGKRAYRCIVGAVTLKSFISYGWGAFAASFFFRNHTAELADLAARLHMKSGGLLGVSLALTIGVTAIIGTLLGGALADRFGAKDLRAYVRIPALGALLSLPFSLAALNVPTYFGALALLATQGLFTALWLGPAYAAVQGLVQPNSRATASAVMLFCSNLIGLGMGPVAVGLLSDTLAVTMGDAASIKWSMLVFTLLIFPCAALFWTSGKTLRAESVS